MRAAAPAGLGGPSRGQEIVRGSFRPLLTFVLLTLALVPAAVAAPDIRESGKRAAGRCTQKAPGVFIDNNWAWGASGSYGTLGPQLTYAIDVFNYDVGCSPSSFTVSLSAPSGFSVSLPASSIRLESGSSGYLYAYITSPSVIADGDYPLSATVRASSGRSGSATSWYKVYSSDSAAPTLFWPGPGNGTTIARGSYNVAVWASDDHSVKRIDLVLDNAYVAGRQRVTTSPTTTRSTTPGPRPSASIRRRSPRTTGWGTRRRCRRRSQSPDEMRGGRFSPAPSFPRPLIANVVVRGPFRLRVDHHRARVRARLEVGGRCRAIAVRARRSRCAAGDGRRRPAVDLRVDRHGDVG
jgi:hypothetical protein